tara:strand:+ start:328 stop:1122 length:795 start_codon:yes stop_codon:yes gene_type:complete
MIPAFVINLDNRIHRWERFDDRKLGIVRIRAVDTRKDSISFSRFGLSVAPPDKLGKLYFNSSPGAIGCYLSHYVFWKHVVENDLPKAVVFEDDALITDVEGLIKDDKNFELLDSKEPTLIQFNKRTTYEKLPFWFNGTESYAVNKAAAQALINLTHDFSDMTGHDIEYAWDVPNTGVTKKHLTDMWADHDSKIDYKTKNIIRYAADKFIGYCSHPAITSPNRIKIHIKPKIALFNNDVPSDVLGNAKFWWNMNLDDIKHITRDL